EPPFTAGLSVGDVEMIRVSERSDRSVALVMDHSHLTRREPKRRETTLACHHLGSCPCGAAELPPLAGTKLNVVDERTERDDTERSGVADLELDVLAGPDRISNLNLLRSQDVGEITVGVLYQT